ncbi:unnamed protein product [Darwinula stevensoni]|uniref:Mos1 transposase HTH domain-containing protein n=1 Tax=Darwinula stevensoni TaxID=69355 RepID=A0A7R9A937_9CRUS|nr:unnamed protein product [Darwinula stevensoni]CAG0897015.1 unnamed protein product [Darwinula stevensoni]
MEKLLFASKLRSESSSPPSRSSSSRRKKGDSKGKRRRRRSRSLSSPEYGERAKRRSRSNSKRKDRHSSSRDYITEFRRSPSPSPSRDRSHKRKEERSRDGESSSSSRSYGEVNNDRGSLRDKERLPVQVKEEATSLPPPPPPPMNQPYPLTKEQVRLLLLYDFRIKKKAANSIADINTAFGPDTVSKSTAYDWYSRFQKGNESLEDQPRTGRPSEFDNSALQEALEANNRQTSRELADLLESGIEAVEEARRWADALLSIGGEGFAPETFHSSRSQKASSQSFLSAPTITVIGNGASGSESQIHQDALLHPADSTL